MTTYKKVGIVLLVGVGVLWLYSYLKKNSTPKSSLDNTDNSTDTDNTVTTDNSGLEQETVTNAVIQPSVRQNTVTSPNEVLMYESSFSHQGGGGNDWTFKHLEDITRQAFRDKGDIVYSWSSKKTPSKKTTQLTYSDAG